MFQYTIRIQFRGVDLFPSGWLNPSEGMFMLLLTGYFTYFPLISHTAIAMNRHTAIVWPTRHAKVETASKNVQHTKHFSCGRVNG